MTDLSKRLTKLKFTTADLVREKGKYRAVTVEATPEFAIIRLSGLRQEFTVGWAAMYSLGVKMQVAAEKAEKKRKKSS